MQAKTKKCISLEIIPIKKLIKSSYLDDVLDFKNSQFKKRNFISDIKGMRLLVKYSFQLTASSSQPFMQLYLQNNTALNLSGTAVGQTPLI